MDLTCVGCGWVSWTGAGGAIVEGTPRAGVLIETDDGWHPSGRWECSQCHHVVREPSPKQAVLDAVVADWLAGQRV